ncbi:23611_t:CDS:2, partial [Dentiscutata erythropus]
DHNTSENDFQPNYTGKISIGYPETYLKIDLYWPQEVLHPVRDTYAILQSVKMFTHQPILIPTPQNSPAYKQTNNSGDSTNKYTGLGRFKIGHFKIVQVRSIQKWQLNIKISPLRNMPAMRKGNAFTSGGKMRGVVAKPYKWCSYFET